MATPKDGKGRGKKRASAGVAVEAAPASAPLPASSSQWLPGAARKEARRLVRQLIPNENSWRARHELARISNGECDTPDGFREVISEIASPVEVDQAVAYIEEHARRAAAKEAHECDIAGCEKQPLGGDAAVEATAIAETAPGDIAPSEATDAPPTPTPAPEPSAVPGTPKPAKPRTTRKKAAETTSALPVPQAYYSVIELPPETVPNAEPGIVNKQGITRGFWAVWWNNAPQLDALEPPDECGVYEGANCFVEAMGEADRVVRAAKGPRAYARPLHQDFAFRVYRDGLRKRKTALTTEGEAALYEFGISKPYNLDVLTERFVRAEYRQLISSRMLHPDSGGDPEAFMRVTRLLDVAVLYVRAMREQAGLHFVPEAKPRRKNVNARVRAYLVQIVRKAKTPGDVYLAETATLREFHEALVRKDLAEYAKDIDEHAIRVTDLGRAKADEYRKELTDSDE